MRKNHIVIIDGKNLLWRNSDAFSELTAYVDGEDINTGGMYGFVAGLIRINARYRGRVIVAWEGKNNFRFDLYPQYKNRDKKTKDQSELAEEVRENEGRLVEFLSFAGVRQFYGVGCEADDVMGTIATTAKKKGLNSIIYTGDSDLRQLVDSNVLVASPGRGGDIIYDSKAVKRKHGVVPKRLPILKALSGDNSDNIPGLSGIGDKTAASLVSLYGSLKSINIAANPEMKSEDWPVAERFKEIVWNGRNDSELFLKLTTIKIDAKLKSVPVCKDKKEVVRLLKAYKFRSLSSAAELLSIMDLGV
jgi:DNA polymerase-1